MKLPKGVFKYLDISTCHVTQGDMNKLAANNTDTDDQDDMFVKERSKQ